jgi:protein-disulfide isomerase
MEAAMIGSGIRDRMVVLVAIVGVAVALLSGLSQHLDWVANLCGVLGHGCSETSKFVVLGIPVWLLGVGFYIAVIGAALFLSSAVFWLAMSGIGMELSFVWVMLDEKVVCVFCLVNLCIMLLMFVLALDRARIWQTLALASVFLLFGLGLVTKVEPPQAKVAETMPVAAAEMPDESFAAKIGDKKITWEEFESPLLMRVYEFDMQAYRIKRERLEQMIAQMIFEKEAARRGIPLQQLLDETVGAQASEVSAEEVEHYFHENPTLRSNWKGTPEDLDKHVRASLQQRKAYQMIMDKARSLYAQEGVVINLHEPEVPRVRVNIGDAMIRGAANGPVTIVEFSDYQCPACRKNHETMRTVMESYKDQVKWIYKDFPLRSHQWAAKAAEAARCAAEQDKFGAYQDLLFGSSQEPKPEQLLAYAAEAGLDVDRFKHCVDSGKYRAAVEKSVLDGQSIGVNSTPTLVINGKIMAGGQSVESLKKLIDDELAKKEGPKP